MARHNRLFPLLAAPFVLLCFTAGTWISSPGKGSHSAGGALASFSTTFPGADETPLSEGGVWITGAGAANTVNLVSLAAEAGGASSLASVVTPAFANNQKATITLHASTQVSVAPAVRIQSSSNPACYVAFVASTTSVQIYKIDSSLGSTTVGSGYTVSTMVAADTLSLSASGTTTTTLELFKNGVSQGTRTDSSSAHTGGQPGFFLDTGSRIDAFSATDL